MADPDSLAEAGHPDAAGWMLGVLDPEKSGPFETHLESCPECQQATVELGSAAEMLKTVLPGAQLVDGPEPPPDLQARTLGRRSWSWPTCARARPSPSSRPGSASAPRPPGGMSVRPSPCWPPGRRSCARRSGARRRPGTPTSSWTG